MSERGKTEIKKIEKKIPRHHGTCRPCRKFTTMSRVTSRAVLEGSLSFYSPSDGYVPLVERLIITSGWSTERNGRELTGVVLSHKPSLTLGGSVEVDP